MKRVTNLAVAVCLTFLCPNAAEACHGCVGQIEVVGVDGNSLHIGLGVEYSMINLRINDPASAGFSFNTGVATWLDQTGITVVDTTKEQGFRLLDENAPIKLPIGSDDPSDDIPRGFYLGDLIPSDLGGPFYAPIGLLNQHITVTYELVGTPGTQTGGFTAPAIPEPSSFALAGMACVLVTSLRRYREFTNN